MTDEAVEESAGQLERTSKGYFAPGVSGNPAGRPKGSKNVITTQKLLLEEAVRNGNVEKLQQVLNKVIDQALEGHWASQKLIWESCMSKQAIQDDKSSGNRQEIRVHTLNVTPDRGVVIEGDIIEGEVDG